MFNASTVGRPTLRLDDKPEVEAQVGRIGYAHQQVRPLLILLSAKHNVAGDGFIEAQRIQAVCARQVQNTDALPVCGFKQAFLALDGHPCIVRDLLPAAGQQIEQGGLSAIGVTEQCDAQRRLGTRHDFVADRGAVITRTWSASKRRRAKVV